MNKYLYNLGYKRTVLINCPYKDNFCDGKPFTGKTSQLPPCPYRQNGQCNHREMLRMKFIIDNGSENAPNEDGSNLWNTKTGTLSDK